MTNPIKQTVSAVKVIALIVNFLIILSLVVTAGYFYNRVDHLKNDIEKNEITYKAELERLKVQALEVEVKHKEQEIKANEKYIERINEIHNNAMSNSRIIDRVRNDTKETYKYLSDMERTALENEFKAKSEQFVRSAELLAGVVQVGLEYDAEIDACYGKYPKPPKNNDVK